MEKVSVIIPVYNCAKYLKHTLHSAQVQTYKNIEIIVVDDASTDNSLQVAKDFAKEDSRITILHMPRNRGVSACRNAALDIAEGRYVAFLDSDDLWSKYKIEKQLKFMQENDAGLSHTACAYINEKGQMMPTGLSQVDFKVNLLKYLKTTQIGLSTTMIDTQKFPNLRFPEDRSLCEDAQVWIPLLRRGEYFYGLNEVLMLYRVRQNQLSGNKLKMAKNTFLRYMKEKDIPFYKRINCFLQYAYHGVEKRTIKNDLDESKILSEFNCRPR